MVDAVWTPAGIAVWGPGAAAFFAGVFVGWLVWGGRRIVRPPAGTAPPELVELQSQIRTARETLAEQEADQEAFSAHLGVLEASIRRAHAGLKAVLRALRSSGR